MVRILERIYEACLPLTRGLKHNAHWPHTTHLLIYMAFSLILFQLQNVAQLNIKEFFGFTFFFVMGLKEQKGLNFSN
jgi:hypothetical protein